MHACLLLTFWLYLEAVCSPVNLGNGQSSNTTMVDWHPDTGRGVSGKGRVGGWAGGGGQVDGWVGEGRGISGKGRDEGDGSWVGGGG